MTAELPQGVRDRLAVDNHGWLTTVAKSGQPVPHLVWFLFDGDELTVYSMPNAAKVAHIKARPRVSLSLDKESLAAFNARLKIAIDKVWTTPPAE